MEEQQFGKKEALAVLRALLGRGSPLLAGVIRVPRESRGFPTFGVNVSNTLTAISNALGHRVRSERFKASQRVIDRYSEHVNLLQSVRSPAIWVFGFQRSGTRSVRALIGQAYFDNYFRNSHTHNPWVLKRLLTESSDRNVALVCTRDPVEAISSLAVKRFGGLPSMPSKWVSQLARNWMSFNRTVSSGNRGNLVHVPFAFLQTEMAPQATLQTLVYIDDVPSLQQLSAAMLPGNFDRLHALDLQKYGQAKHPRDFRNGNLPNPERRELIGEILPLVQRYVSNEIGGRQLQAARDRDLRRTELLVDCASKHQDWRNWPQPGK